MEPRTIINTYVLSDSDFFNMNVILEILHIKHKITDMYLYAFSILILKYC